MRHRALMSAALLWILLCATAPVRSAGTLDSPAVRAGGLLDATEADTSGWALYLDNDALLPVDRDEDYTGGIALTVSGARTQHRWFSLDPALGAMDGLLGMSAPFGDSGRRLHSLQIGTAAFTPGDKLEEDVVSGDRPYASLVYLASGRNMVAAGEGVAFHSSLTLGILGLDVAADLQSAVHDVIGASEPRGWHHQISDGGEPTLRYTLARQDLLSTAPLGRHLRYELKSTVAGSIGYLTGASSAVSLRVGRIATPWWSFPPERVEYSAEPFAIVGSGGDGPRELFFWTGLKLHARVYNALLQGQFRDSDLTYRRSELRTLIGEAWAGVTWQFAEEYRVSWVMRYQSSELQGGPGDRDVLWGSLFISRAFGS